MLASKHKQQTQLLLCLAALAFTIQFTHDKLNQMMPSYGSDYHNKRLILKPAMAQALTFGFNRIVADFYWLAFAQYYGDFKACKEENYRYAADYLRLVVSLDPHFIRPYWYAAFVLAGDKLDRLQQAKQAALTAIEHTGKDPTNLLKQCDTLKQNIVEESKKILDDGIKQNPQDWTLPYIAGFSQYMFAKNDKLAGYYYRMAARMPYAPVWLDRTAKMMESGVASKIQKDARTWYQTYFTTQDPGLKQLARDKAQIVYSQIYYMALKQKLDKIPPVAKDRLNQLGVDLLPEEALPKESAPTNSDELLKFEQK